LAPEPVYDYVIVGSGAGGGTLAARLAEGGMRVCLLEAGGDALAKGAGDRLPEDYEVPAFHPFASENLAMSWNFYVRHYEDDAKQKADPKCCPDPDTGEPSVFYPRAATLGGCTAHNAMIFVAPNDSDWDYIANLTGDTSWRAREMRRYFQRLEDCRHRQLWRFLRWFGLDPTGHGWKGWLSVERALPRRVRDGQIFRMLICTAWTVIFGGSPWTAAIRRLVRGEADPNDGRRLRQRAEGLCYTPLSTRGHKRGGVRERVLDVARRHPKHLHIEYDALATRVVFDDEKLLNGEYRATGVEYLKGERLYGAHENASAEPGERLEVRAAREVILAGGAFNTPQLLMLSGIGPREVLEKHSIPVRVELAGVGQNLQDRYEVAVVHQMAKPWSSLKGARFERGDRLYKEWSDHRRDWHTHGGGMYTSNGAAIAFSKRSTPERKEPDLFCMALLTRFAGYYPGYSKEVRERLDYLSFALLKAYTNNRGRVTLRSDDPRRHPEINFHYFEEGDDVEKQDHNAKQDLDAVIAGIDAVRKITAPMKRRGLIGPEERPGEKIQDPKDLEREVRRTAWGHHASCTCPIGLETEGGVLSSDFKVHGTQGLRVVDASVFPRIPGFFIASAIYMIAEKAADVILRETRG
jgi:choline dehydrogenase